MSAASIPNRGASSGGGGRGSVKKKKDQLMSRFRASSGSANGGNTGLPRTSLLRPRGDWRVSSLRPGASTSQPQYDFLAGGDDDAASITHNGLRKSTAARPSSRARSFSQVSHESSSRENAMAPDAEQYESQRKRAEELQAEVSTMRFQISNLKREKEMDVLQHAEELRKAQKKANDDYSVRQQAEGDRVRAQRQIEQLQEEFASAKADWEREKIDMEARLREVDEEKNTVAEQLDELSTMKDEEARLNQKRCADLEVKIQSLERVREEREKEMQEKDTVLTQTQEQLAEKVRAIGDLEADVLRLKAQTGDADTIAVIRRELTDQVQHIRNLESKNSKQHAELSHLRQIHKAVEIVEEEKRSLQRKLDTAESLEVELAEARIQRQRLTDERLAWTAYLQNASEFGGTMEFDSPEAVARALVEERLNSASLLAQLGEKEPQVAERDEIIRCLEREKKDLAAQAEKLKTAGPAMPVDKARARMERQRNLAVKEAEYLRAQLKTFDTEDETFEPEKVDQQRQERITHLEQLIDNYKAEVQKLHQELFSIEKSPPEARSSQPDTAATATPTTTNTTTSSNKRPRADEEEDDDVEASDLDQIGALNRKRRKLTDELSRAQTSLKVLEKENSVLQTRLHAAESQSKTRVLSLRSNPTSNWEAIKVASLTALKEENAHLLSQLSGQAKSSRVPVIPASQLAAAKRGIEEAHRETASALKSADRLKKVWAAKSQEFKEAIFSTLGWTVTFIPNGKMRVESVFYPSETDEHENSIVFDGERGTMKVSGGPQSRFARRIADQIQFWVREKGCIPGFLAALTLEFYDETVSGK